MHAVRKPALIWHCNVAGPVWATSRGKKSKIVAVFVWVFKLLHANVCTGYAQTCFMFRGRFYYSFIRLLSLFKCVSKEKDC